MNEKDNIIYRANGDDWGSIFGKNVCENGKRYHWSFQITNITSDTSNSWKLLIGICDINNCKKHY